MLRNLVLVVALLTTASQAAAATIDFESVSSNTLVRDQFLSEGLKVTGIGTFSGLVISEGALGTANFGNSSTQIMHVGLREEPTILQFVDPSDSSMILGATSFSILMGDGNADAETFAVSYFDITGAALGGPHTFTTLSDGLLVSTTSAILGALIGSVELRLLGSSLSGVTADDLSFTLADTSSTIPEPSTLLLFGTGLAALVTWRFGSVPSSGVNRARLS